MGYARPWINIVSKVEYPWFDWIWWVLLYVVYYELFKPNERITEHRYRLQLFVWWQTVAIKAETWQNNFVTTLVHMLEDRWKFPWKQPNPYSPDISILINGTCRGWAALLFLWKWVDSSRAWKDMLFFKCCHKCGKE